MTARRIARSLAAAAIAGALLGPAAASAPAEDYNAASTYLETDLKLFGSLGTYCAGGRQSKGQPFRPLFTTCLDGDDPKAFVLPYPFDSNALATAGINIDGVNLVFSDGPDGWSMRAVTEQGRLHPECEYKLAGEHLLGLRYVRELIRDTYFFASSYSDTAINFRLINANTCRPAADRTLFFPRYVAPDFFLPRSAYSTNTSAVIVGATEQAGASTAAVARVKWAALLDKLGQPGGPLDPKAVFDTDVPGVAVDGFEIGGNTFLLERDFRRNSISVLKLLANGELDITFAGDGRRPIIDVPPDRFRLLPPAMAVLGGNAFVSWPYFNLRDGTSHLAFTRFELGGTFGDSNDIPVRYPTSISDLLAVEDERELLAFFTLHTDPNKPQNSQRLGTAVLNPNSLGISKVEVPDLSNTKEIFKAPTVDSSDLDLPFLDSSRFDLPLKSSREFVLNAYAGVIPEQSSVARARAARAVAARRSRVRRVQVAVVRLRGGARAAATLKCSWLKSRKVRFKRDTPIGKRCEGFVWLNAKRVDRSRTWSLKLKKPLPSGKYVVYSRATNAHGVTERRFSKRDGNRLRLRVP